MLVVYRTIRSLRGGCIYKRFDVIKTLVYTTVYVFLARHKRLSEDDVLTFNM